MGGMLFLLAIAGAVFDWKYHRAGGKPSSRNDRIRFWVIALLVAGASAFTEFAGWDPYGILGYTTVPLVAVLFVAWELGRWRMRWKYPLPQASTAGEPAKIPNALQAFADDSGSDGTREPYVMAAYLLPASKWESFADEWRKELNREPQIEYFRMAEAAERRGQFAGVPEEFIKYKIRNLLAIIARHQPDALCVKMEWNNYRELLEPALPIEIRHPYLMMFPSLLDALMQYEKVKRIFPEPIDLTVDDQGVVGEMALHIVSLSLDSLTEDAKSVIKRTPTMLDDKTTLPLQAADLLAWNVRREFDPSDPDRKWHWLYTELEKRMVITGTAARETLEAAASGVREHLKFRGMTETGGA